jgi:O-antigen ligase
VKIIFGLILLFWFALHTSQSLLDLSDFLLVIAAVWTAIKAGEMKKLATSYRPWILWPVWIVVVILGFVFGAPVETKVAMGLTWEFRWFISLMCFIYLMSKVAWDEKQLRALTSMFLLISLMDFALFFIDYHKDPRAGGLFGHSMPFAHTMGPAALTFLFLGFKKFREAGQSTFWRSVYVITPLLASLMVVLSFTRGVWIGFAVGLLFCTAFLGRKVFVTAIVTLVVAGAAMFAGSQRIRQRVMGTTNAESQSDNERLLYWKANLQIFRDYPAVGMGYSQNNVHVEEYLRKDGVEWLQGAHAHNQYIHFLAGTGILGLICYLVFLYFLFWPLLLQAIRWRKERATTDQFYLLIGVLAGMVCFVVGSLTESNFSIAKNRFLFLFIASIGYGISMRTRANTVKSK